MVCSTISSHDELLLTSTSSAIASRSALAVCSAASNFTSAHTTWSPRSASARAVAAPIPDPAPVTIATAIRPLHRYTVTNECSFFLSGVLWSRPQHPVNACAGHAWRPHALRSRTLQPAVHGHAAAALGRSISRHARARVAARRARLRRALAVGAPLLLRRLLSGVTPGRGVRALGHGSPAGRNGDAFAPDVRPRETGLGRDRPWRSFRGTPRPRGRPGLSRRRVRRAWRLPQAATSAHGARARGARARRGRRRPADLDGGTARRPCQARRSTRASSAVLGRVAI